MIEELYKYIISINDISECTDFFEDLCTKQEIEKMEIAYDPKPVKKFNKANCEALGIDVKDLEAKGYVAIG